MSIAKATLMCLALNAYWEARNQSYEGMVAVNQVVMNRVASDQYPNDACEVIFQGPTRASWKDPNKKYPVKNRCQFSWYCDGKSDEIKKENKENLNAWRNAVRSSLQVMMRDHKDLVGGALWYHAEYVEPKWAKKMKQTTVIGKHIFYKKNNKNNDLVK
jgi:spore germination cell wall hydrolase CwlJ-like protein